MAVPFPIPSCNSKIYEKSYGAILYAAKDCEPHALLGEGWTADVWKQEGCGRGHHQGDDQRPNVSSVLRVVMHEDPPQDHEHNKGRPESQGKTAPSESGKYERRSGPEADQDGDWYKEALSHDCSSANVTPHRIPNPPRVRNTVKAIVGSSFSDSILQLQDL